MWGHHDASSCLYLPANGENAYGVPRNRISEGEVDIHTQTYGVVALFDRRTVHTRWKKEKISSVFIFSFMIQNLDPLLPPVGEEAQSEAGDDAGYRDCRQLLLRDGGKLERSHSCGKDVRVLLVLSESTHSQLSRSAVETRWVAWALRGTQE